MILLKSHREGTGKRNPAKLTLCAVILCAFGLPGGQQAWAQPDRGLFTDVRELPDGPVGERIEELIDVINSNDRERVRTFINETFNERFRDFAPMDRHLSVFASVYERSQGYDFFGIRMYESPEFSTRHVVILRNRLTQGWAQVSVDIEATPPYRIAGLRFSPARAPKEAKPAQSMSDQQIVKKLKEYVSRMADAGVFSGTVLLAKDGTVLYQAAFGLASKQYDVPNKIDTKFNLGSMNKMFTGVAIAQLAQRGKLSLDDPLSKYLSTDWLPREITDRIKIMHLLTHTSGLGSYFNATFMESSRAMFRDLDDYRPLITDETLAFEPGTSWRYSNTGIFLLGVVIEKVTGQSYFDYVRRNIYEPAGMINSDCYDMDRPVPNLAMGYSKDENGWINNIFKHVIRGGPAGGGFSTVEDLLRFDQALRDHKLLNPEYTEMVWSAKPEISSPDYGFGFSVDREGDERIVGHSGGFSGINSNLDMFLDSGYTAAVMSNHDHGAQPIQHEIRRLLAARE